MDKVILEMKNITKTFPGVKALDNVNFKVKEGEIHALIGENGAGKSTLMNVLSGIYSYGTYTGDIIFEDNICKFNFIKDSEKLGIVIIHQELALIPELSIAENMFLGNERAKGKVIDWNETEIKALEILRRVNLIENVKTKIKNIGVGKQQLVEIAKALAKNVKLLILDEPTAALNEEDSKNLLMLLKQLKSEGITSILISHKLNELMEVADTITILRDGATVASMINDGNVSEDDVIKGMVGRDLTNRYPEHTPKIGEVVFEVKDWNVYDPMIEGKRVIKDININVKKGEIVGLSGLMGAGRTELAMSIFGRAYGTKISGKVIKDGKELSIKTIRQAIDCGIAYVTEDRKLAGLNLIDSIKNNIPIAKIKKISNNLFVDDNKEVEVAEEFRDKLKIKCPTILQKTGNLSGGNQQKVVLSKWIFTDPDVLILDEPTRGIDVGAKYEIYKIINKLADEGKSIIVISSELPEILGICDRVYVVNEGRIVGELDREEATQESIMKCIMNSNKEVV